MSDLSERAMLCFTRGLAHKEQGQLAEAAQCFRQAVHLWPLHRNAAETISRAAASRSSYWNTTAGFFPPSSS